MAAVLRPEEKHLQGRQVSKVVGGDSHTYPFPSCVRLLPKESQEGKGTGIPPYRTLSSLNIALELNVTLAFSAHRSIELLKFILSIGEGKDCS